MSILYFHFVLLCFHHNAQSISAYIRIISSLLPSLPATSSAHYSSLCLSMPGCSVSTSLQFQKHQILLGHSWAPWPIYPPLPWIPTNPHSSTSPPCHHHCINTSSPANTAPGARRKCVCALHYPCQMLTSLRTLNTRIKTHTGNMYGNKRNLHYRDGEVKDGTVWC